MEIFQIFEGLIKEEERNKQAEYCIKMFGYELFGDQLGGKEPNTNYESDVLQNIFNFTLISYGKTITQEFIKAVKNLKLCMSSYPEILYPQGIVYRGTKISLKNLLRIKYKPNTWNKIEYRANTPIQSWSENEEVAEEFAASQIDRYTYDMINLINKANDKDIKSILEKHPDLFDKFKVGIIIKHEATPDQFLFKGKYFNALSQAGVNVDDSEDEVLRVDNRPMVVDFKIPDEYETSIMLVIKKIKKYNESI